jgi:hypothetical protein
MTKMEPCVTSVKQPLVFLAMKAEVVAQAVLPIVVPLPTLVVVPLVAE